MTQLDELSFGLISSLLQARTGQELTETRRWRVGTVLSPLFRDYGITTSSQFLAKITEDEEGAFVGEMIDALLNNETYFFRDPAVFTTIREQVLPKLASQLAHRKQLRIWSVGCSTGQEALSLAMLFAESPATWDGWTIEVVGTDVSAKAIASARRGIYSHFEVQRGLAIGQMLRFFDETPTGWRVKPDLARMVEFHEENLLDKAPKSSTFDLILCRNVLLYFDLATRTRAFQRLGEAMNSHSRLLLGGGETVVGQTGYVRPDNSLPGFFRLAQSASDGEQFQLAASS
jgi:chemotaxis protein methyltransferase CheR